MYKLHPNVKTHPDYNFFYFFTDYPEKQEYLFLIVYDFLIDSPLAQETNNSLNLYKNMFNFTEATIMSTRHFEVTFLKEYEELKNKLRRSEFNCLLYEVW